MKEWEFEVDSEEVDIEEIYNELTKLDLSYIEGRPEMMSNRPAVIEVQAYLSTLKQNAPRVFERFSEKYPTIGCIKVKK